MRDVHLVRHACRGDLADQFAGLMFFIFKNLDRRLGLRIEQRQRSLGIGDDRLQGGLIF